MSSEKAPGIPHVPYEKKPADREKVHTSKERKGLTPEEQRMTELLLKKAKDTWISAATAIREMGLEQEDVQQAWNAAYDAYLRAKRAIIRYRDSARHETKKRHLSAYEMSMQDLDTRITALGVAAGNINSERGYVPPILDEERVNEDRASVSAEELRDQRIRELHALHASGEATKTDREELIRLMRYRFPAPDQQEEPPVREPGRDLVPVPPPTPFDYEGGAPEIVDAEFADVRAEVPLVMVNSVLTKQSLGGSKKKYEQFKQRWGEFPAAPTQGGVAARAGRPAKAAGKGSWWSRASWGERGGVAATGAAGLGVVAAAWAFMSGARTEAPPRPEQKAPPPAAKSAAEAGVPTAPPAGIPTVTANGPTGADKLRILKERAQVQSAPKPAAVEANPRAADEVQEVATAAPEEPTSPVVPRREYGTPLEQFRREPQADGQ